MHLRYIVVELHGRVRIEPWGVEDAELLAGISKRAFDTDIEVGAPSPGGPPGYDDPEFHVRIMRYLECYKTLLDDSIVGGIIADLRGEEHSVLERIFVEPELHRRGIGARAFELLWELYPGVRLWTLGTPEWNNRTKRFYEKMGFVQVGWDLGDPGWRGRWYEKVMDPSRPYAMARLGELRDGMRSVTVEGVVVERSIPRAVRSRSSGETLTVANATLQDDAGRVVLVLWNDQIRQAKVGDRVRVENGYVNSYLGVTQLNIGRGGRLITLI
ncbi:MAG: GNAT family N-acetyltransferase [Candidatus Bathyarchaeota archaeon]|nr:MAG: GNAT family N-acetyltransferase [Candidatus Bathyarchaeota archaeon]